MDASIHNDLTPEQQAWLWAGNRLELTLFVTERCNFRCTYCYEDFSKGRMRPDVVAAVQTLIRTRASDGLKELHLSFFGGEPLLAKQVHVHPGPGARKAVAASSKPEKAG